MRQHDLAEFLSVVHNAEQQPLRTFEALENLVQQTIGVKLFTIMQQDKARGVAWRSYSNMPHAYPISGEKPLHKNRWSEIVEDNNEIFVANTIEEIAEVFNDYALIQSLGCESCINIPVVVAGRMLGTLNCLHEAGFYNESRVQTANTLKLAGTISFLMAGNFRGNDNV